jgi:hypothetical protein
MSERLTNQTGRRLAAQSTKPKKLANKSTNTELTKYKGTKMKPTIGLLMK